MVALARKMDLFSVVYVATPDEAVEMAKAGADAIIAHVGTTPATVRMPSHMTVIGTMPNVNSIKAMPVAVRQRLGQGFVDAPVGAGDGLGADALDDIQRRQDDVPVAQRV